MWWRAIVIGALAALAGVQGFAAQDTISDNCELGHSGPQRAAMASGHRQSRTIASWGIWGPQRAAMASGHRQLNQDVAALVRRGDAYRKTTQHDRAIQEYTEAIRLAPKEALPYFNRGLAYEALGHDMNALLDFTAAVKLNPKSSAGFERRATVYFRMGLYDRAGSDYTAAVFLDPKNAAALYGRGVTQRMDRFNPASTAEADIAAAKAVQADIADEMSARGVK